MLRFVHRYHHHHHLLLQKPSSSFLDAATAGAVDDAEAGAAAAVRLGVNYCRRDEVAPAFERLISICNRDLAGRKWQKLR